MADFSAAVGVEPFEFGADREKVARDPLFDPFATPNSDDPYPGYKRLRDEHPIYHVREWNVWVISRYKDIETASRDWKTFTSSPSVDIDDTDDVVGPGAFIDQEPPHHDELRAVLRSRFIPATIAQEYSLMVERLVERMVAELDPSGADLAKQLAWPLPVAMLCHMMGFPSEDVESLTPLFKALSAREPGTRDVPQWSRDAADALSDYVLGEMRERQRKPGDDLLSVILAARKEGTIAPNEVRGMCLLLCNAGTSTTAALLGNAFADLGTHPDQRRILAQSPKKIQAGVEELLRFNAPVQYLGREAAEEVELHGVTIPAGARIALLYGAANRDDRRYEDPETLDVTREPKRNLAFGEGIHFCIGAPLARLESRIMLTALLREYPDYELVGPGERSAEHTTRGYYRLPVVLNP